MKTALFAAASLAVLFHQPAAAQSSDGFSGFHAGAKIGWGRDGGAGRIGSDGFVYGGTVGYDFAFDNVRIGPEAEIFGSTQKVCEMRMMSGTSVRVCQRTDRDLYVGGRVGYVAAPSIMVFAKAGYSNGRFGEYVDKEPWQRRDHDGYRVGAGVEYEFLQAFFVSAEYRYAHYKHDIHTNQLLAGVGVRF